jgi:hypothetical protein
MAKLTTTDVYGILTAHSNTIIKNELTVTGNTYLSPNVGIGTTTPTAVLEVTSTIIDPNIVASAYGTTMGSIMLQRARGTQSLPTQLLSADRIGYIIARTYGISTYMNTAALTFYASENQTETARGSNIRFETTLNGSITRLERMRIDNTGNVGIGTITPDSKLTISYTTGAVTLPALDQTASIHVGSADATHNFLYFDSFAGITGLVGRRAGGTIGTKAATENAATILGIYAYGHTGSAYTTASNAVIRLSASETWTPTANGTLINFGTTPNGSTTMTTRMTINNAGNVGIGETNPDTELHLSKNTGLTMSNGSSSSTGAAKIMPVNGGAATDTGLAFYTQYGTLSEKMRITSGGNIIFALGSASYATYISGSNTNTLNAGFNDANDTSDLWLNYKGYQGGTTYFRDTKIGNGKNVGIVFVDGSAGNVGIGVIGTTPVERLHVEGNIRIDDAAGNDGFVLQFDNTSKVLNFNYVGT